MRVPGNLRRVRVAIARISTIEEILPVMDQFQMAVMAMESSDDTETIKQGMSMILNTFNSSFDNLGIKKLQTVGQTFDPNLHEAVSAEHSDHDVDTITTFKHINHCVGSI